MEKKELQNIIRAIIQASSKPVTLKALCQVFAECEDVQPFDIKEAITALFKARDPVQELKPVAGGYHYHVKPQYACWVRKAQSQDENLETKVEPLSRALLEALAIIAYKQPVSRGEVDYIRGKTTALDLFVQLEERRWIKVIDYGKNGRTALYGTTLEFLEYFGLNDIQDLPELPEFEELSVSLEGKALELETNLV
jgi:segregation and condensation protein B